MREGSSTPPELRDPTDPREWLRRARSNLARARADRHLPEVLYDDLCFDAQQAAEKAVKAVLISRGVEFPKTHDIINLLTLVTSSGLAVPEQVREADRLTRYAAAGRYPGHWEDVTESEYVEAVRLADRVVRWAEVVISGR